MTMEIRLLTADDAGEWWRLRLESLRGDPEGFSASAEDQQSLKEGDVRKRLSSGGTDFFIVGAFEDGRMTGMAGFYRETGMKTRHKGHVWGVYVTQEKRGKGVARNMLQKILERATASEGLDQILVSVAATQVAANRLYRALGFEPFGREPRALKVGDHYIDEESMVLPLRRV